MQLFDRVIDTAFGSMFVVYGLAASLGYYYFGAAASTLVTSNLTSDTRFGGTSFLLPGLTVAHLVAG